MVEYIMKNIVNDDTKAILETWLIGDFSDFLIW